MLPTWEKHQITGLVRRALVAQARYTRLSLAHNPVQRMDFAPELAWRLARKEGFDSLSALVAATQRALVEPRAVQPPLEALGCILANSYQLLAQLTSIKTMLMLRRDRLQMAQIDQPLKDTARRIDELLLQPRRASLDANHAEVHADAFAQLPDPFESDLTPWMLRRLGLLSDIALQLSAEAAAFAESG